MHNTEDLFQNEDGELEFILNPEEPLVLLLGWVDHEGILSSLKSSNRQYKKKILDSLPENWETILQIFDQYKVSCVLGKLTPRVVHLLSEDKYSEVKVRLFAKLSTIPNQFFMFDDLFLGQQDDKFKEQYKFYPTKETIENIITWLRQQKIHLVPYKTNAEVTVLAESFLDDTERNLLFRIYVPAGRIWSNEADRFLELFRDYLTKVDKVSVRLDQRRTDYGVIYEFHGDSPSNGSELTTEFQNFSHLMDLCATDIEAATSLLRLKSLNPSDLTTIISRYSKEAKRLHLDIKQEAEHKALAIRHRFESEFLDYGLTDAEWIELNAIITKIIPLSGNLMLAHFFAPNQANTGGLTLNIRPQFIQAVNNVTAQEIYGNQHFTHEHNELINIINKYGSDNKVELETAVYEIADKSGKEVDKLKASKVLKDFLISVSKKTGEIAVNLLQSWIEKQLGL